MTEMYFVRPSETIPISVTGRDCALNCLHCGGNYLIGKKGMSDIETMAHAPSYLITGGCDSAGKVPILQHLDKLNMLPEESTRIAHTGLVDNEDVGPLSDVIDVVSFDFVGDDGTIREVYGLDKSVGDYEESYSAVSSRIPTYPHLTIGLYKGRLAGELDVLEFLESAQSKAIVLNVFIPTRGTALGEVPPPRIDDVRMVVKKARESFDELYSGCMRPGGRYRNELDQMLAEEGCDRIVNPARTARDFAAKNELDVHWKEECCIL